MLQNAVPSKSLSQIKNYYYDHKKQLGKQKAGPQEGANGISTMAAASVPLANHSGTNTPMMEQQLYQKVTLENGQEVLLTPGGSLAHMGQNADIWAQQQQLALAMQQQQQQQASWVAAAQHMAQARVAQAQAAALQQQQQQQQQHEMPSAAMLRDWLESQAAGQQNANLALAQQLAAAQNGGGFAALLGQNVSGLNNASLGMAAPDETGMQSNLNAALLSQIANAVQQGGGNVGQQQHQGTSSTPPADALALLARLSGANNGDGRHQM